MTDIKKYIPSLIFSIILHHVMGVKSLLRSWHPYDSFLLYLLNKLFSTIFYDIL